MKSLLKWIDKLAIWVSNNGFTLLKVIGIPFTFWLQLILGNRLKVIPWNEDKEDTHTYKHFSICLIGTLFFTWIFNFHIVYAAGFSFLIAWLGWELIADGLTQASDPRGYQISDVGADFLGSFIPVMLYYIGLLVK